VKRVISLVFLFLIEMCCSRGVAAEGLLTDDVALSTTVLSEMQITSARASLFNPGGLLGSGKTKVIGAVVLSPSVAGIRSRLRLEAARDIRRDIWIDPSAEVQELYTTLNIVEGVQATVGKSFLSWDVSYASRPVNFFTQGIDYIDIRDHRRRNSGVPMVALSWIGKAGTITGVVASDCSEDMNRGQWALRAQGHTGPAEVAALIRSRFDGLFGFGGTVTYVHGRSLELHGSLFLNRSTSDKGCKGAPCDPFSLFGPESSAIYMKKPVRYGWYPHLVFGGQYTTESRFNVLVEYIHEGFGLSDTQWDRLLGAADALNRTGFLGASPSAVKRNFFNIAASLRPRLVRRDYLFVRASTMWDEIEGSTGVLVGLADGGASLSGTLGYHPQWNWDVWVEVRRNLGPKGSEFGEVPERMRLTLMLRFLF